ncbi:MAG: hypothetical protein ACRD4Q_01695 [Candidatus Acidiferrales bacterium]
MRVALIVAVFLAVLVIAGHSATPSIGLYTGHISIYPNQSSGTLSFPVQYTQGEDCVASPLQDMGNTQWWIDKNLDSITIMTSDSTGGFDFSFICNGT